MPLPNLPEFQTPTPSATSSTDGTRNYRQCRPWPTRSGCVSNWWERRCRRATKMKKTFVRLGVVLALGVVVGLIGIQVSINRAQARQLVCLCHLKCIGCAMHEYHGKYGHFP